MRVLDQRIDQIETGKKKEIESKKVMHLQILAFPVPLFSPF
jgi:hypothetical protein